MRCPHCEGEFVFVPGWKYCSFCGRTLFSDDLPEPRMEMDAHSADNSLSTNLSPQKFPCSWEDPMSPGFFRPLFVTIRDSSLNPRLFFSELSAEGGYGLPVLYAVNIQMMALTARLIWAGLFGASGLAGSLGAGSPAWSVTLMPLIASVGLMTWGVLIQGALIVLNGKKRSLDATIRIVCYSAGPELICAAPLVGEVVGFIWKAYITFTGLMTAHGVGPFKAAAAMLIPLAAIAGAVLLLLLLGLVFAVP